MEKVVTKYFHRHLSVYAAIIMMFSYNVLLDRDFSCSCKGQRRDCSFYIALPPVIIVVLILWTDRTLLSICRHAAGTHCWSWMPRLLKALLVGLLWVAFVLIDGDWFVCCFNNLSDLLVHLPCTDQTRITPEERIWIIELKNSSRVSFIPAENIWTRQKHRTWSLLSCQVYGSVLLLLIVILAASTSVCERKPCCTTQPLFQRLILEAEGNKLEEVLRKAVEDKLTEKVRTETDNGRWDRVYDITETLIKESQRGQNLEGREERRRAEPQLNVQEEELELEQRPE